MSSLFNFASQQITMHARLELNYVVCAFKAIHKPPEASMSTKAFPFLYHLALFKLC